MIVSKRVFHDIYDNPIGKRALWMLCSFFIVALAQLDWSFSACLLAASLGYALFWQSIDSLSPKLKFIVAVCWMTLIQLIQQSWLARPDFIGPIIYLGWFLHTISYGLVFGCISLYVRPKMCWLTTVGLASLGVLLDIVRPYLFFDLRFAWNPPGLALTASSYSLLFASIGGMLGLNFWVYWTNLLIYQRKKLGLVLAIIPYIVGGGLHAWHAPKLKTTPTIQTLLIQQAHKPRTPAPDVWNNLYQLLATHIGQSYDLIALSEGGLPNTAQLRYIPASVVKNFFHHYWGVTIADMAEDLLFTNIELMQKMAKIFNTPMVVGMSDDLGVEGVFNGAFYIHPKERVQKYHKRYLLPFGEYMPFCFSWVRFFIPQEQLFNKGKRVCVMGQQLPIGVAICYEETISALNRKNRLSGAQLLLGLTNDVWYPRSRLPLCHLHHARVRVAELGVPLIRACNTGVTCAVDSLGNIIAKLPYETRKQEAPAATLSVRLPLYHYKTLYLIWGDWLVLAVCTTFFMTWVLSKKPKI